MREGYRAWLLTGFAMLASRGAVAAGLESGNLRLDLTTGPSQFSFSVANKANNQTVLTSSSTAFGAASVVGVTGTTSGNDGQHDFVSATLSLSGGGFATAKFTLVSPQVVQVDLNGPAGTAAISQMFT